MDTDIVSSLTSHGPGYISEETKDLEQIVGLQTDKPLKRAFMPYGGIKMAEESCRNYGYEPSERLHEIFTKYSKTHNTAVFDAYTPEMKKQDITRSSQVFQILMDVVVLQVIIVVLLYTELTTYQKKKKMILQTVDVV